LEIVQLSLNKSSTWRERTGAPRNSILLHPKGCTWLPVSIDSFADLRY